MAVMLSALRAGRPSHPRKIPGTHFRQRLCRPEGHSAAGRIRSIEKPNDLKGNRTRNLPPCSIVPQPTALPRAPTCTDTEGHYDSIKARHWTITSARLIHCKTSHRPIFILSFHLRLGQVVCSLQISRLKFSSISHLSDAWYMSHPSHISWPYRPDNIRQFPNYESPPPVTFFLLNLTSFLVPSSQTPSVCIVPLKLRNPKSV
jgi:hypothetical protein